MFVSESQEVSMGEEAYRHELRNSVLLRDYEAERLVRKVGERIARAANKPDYKWEFHVIDDPEMVNAFAVPGGKVAVYSGIFPAARDEAPTAWTPLSTASRAASDGVWNRAPAVTSKPRSP